MPRFIRINFRRPVQALRRFHEFPSAGVQIKKFKQRRAVIALPVGRVIQFAQEFQHLGRSTPRRRDVFHDRDELPPLSPAPLELLQLPRQRDRCVLVFAVEQAADQPDHLLHPSRIRLKQLPYQRLGLGKPPCRNQRICVRLAELRRRRSRILLCFQNEDRRSYLPLRQQTLPVRQRDLRIRRVFLIRLLVPRRTVAALSQHGLRNFLKRCCRQLALAQFRC